MPTDGRLPAVDATFTIDPLAVSSGGSAARIVRT